MHLLSLILMSNPSFADDDKNEDTEKTEKAKKKKTKTLDKNPGKPSQKENKKTIPKKSNDATINTIKPGGIKTKKEHHKRTTESRTLPTDSGTRKPTSDRNRRTSIGTPAKNPNASRTSTSSRKRRARTGKSSSTTAAVAGITTAAVGMAAMALLPTKNKQIKCPFNKARVGIRGGSQLSRPEEGAFGGGAAIGYRWCNPFALDISYAHYGEFESSFNAPLQTSVQMFLFNSLVSAYVSGGISVAHEQGAETEWLYGPHGGIGAQLLFKSGESIAAISLEGRYTQYSNEGEKPQDSQIHALLGLDFYF